MSSARRARFGLDQNFPTPIIDALRDYVVEAELVPIGQIHSRLPTLDDWQLLFALGEQTPTCDGLITTDNSMLLQDRELAALIQSKLTLVVADAAGDDPIKATGLLLAHLPWIAKQPHRHQAQIWLLRTASRPAEDPWERLKRIGKQHGETDPRSLYDRYKIDSPSRLVRELLAPRQSRRTEHAAVKGRGAKRRSKPR